MHSPSVMKRKRPDALKLPQVQLTAVAASSVSGHSGTVLQLPPAGDAAGTALLLTLPSVSSSQARTGHAAAFPARRDCSSSALLTRQGSADLPSLRVPGTVSSSQPSTTHHSPCASAPAAPTADSSRPVTPADEQSVELPATSAAEASPPLAEPLSKEHQTVPSGETATCSKAVLGTELADPSHLRGEDLEKLCVIGRGSSGLVWKVRYRPTGAVLVLKVINLNRQSEQLQAQVAGELHALSGARSAHVVNYLHAFCEDGNVAIVMEHMNGGSLSDVTRRHGPLPEPALAQVARQVLQGLAHLHGSLRVVHRDIKPSNLLLSMSGACKIGDFGVSNTLANSVSKCVTWVGTVTYMSPERIAGRRYGIASDIWSLGLTVMECAQGRFPYLPEAGGSSEQAGQQQPRRPLSFWDLLHLIAEKEPPQLDEQHYSPQLCHFVACCLCKVPEERWSAARLLSHPFIVQHPDNPSSVIEFLESAPQAAPAAMAPAAKAAAMAPAAPAAAEEGAEPVPDVQQFHARVLPRAAPAIRSNPLCSQNVHSTDHPEDSSQA